MKIRIIVVGKIKEKYIRAGVKEYIKRTFCFVLTFANLLKNFLDMFAFLIINSLCLPL